VPAEATPGGGAPFWVTEWDRPAPVSMRRLYQATRSLEVPAVGITKVLLMMALLLVRAEDAIPEDREAIACALYALRRGLAPPPAKIPMLPPKQRGEAA
jgi:hypothetical protein